MQASLFETRPKFAQPPGAHLLFEKRIFDFSARLSANIARLLISNRAPCGFNYFYSEMLYSNMKKTCCLLLGFKFNTCCRTVSI